MYISKMNESIPLPVAWWGSQWNLNPPDPLGAGQSRALSLI